MRKQCVCLGVFAAIAPVCCAYGSTEYSMGAREEGADHKVVQYNIGMVQGVLVAISFEEENKIMKMPRRGWQGPVGWSRAYPPKDGIVIETARGSQHLAYDPTGKKREVFLESDAHVTGSKWNVIRADSYLREHPRNFRAAEGKVAGWWLELGKAETFEHEGVKFQVHRLILVQEPDKEKTTIFDFSDSGAK